MARNRSSIHGQWSTRWAFILAATGSAVGLGNIWRFPYETGEHGGGAFVLVYLLCIAIVGLPILMAETLLGRRGRQSPINAMRVLAREEGRNPQWQWVGVFGVAAGFMILTFYSVVAGWTMAYIFRAAGGAFNDASPAQIEALFNDLVSDPERLLAWHTLFMAITMFVIARGVKRGLEKAVRFLMPALFALVLILAGYALTTPGLGAALAFLFKPDFSKVAASSTILSALGHAFFTLSLGMGAMMTYGSYLPDRVSIPRAAVTIAAIDTVVALLAGLAIFPLVFSYGLDTAGGPGLIFKILPIAFGQMPYGQFIGLLFFALLMFAAWTSALSLLEPATAWLVEQKNFSRAGATLCTGLAGWTLGIGSLLSLNLWADAKLLGLTFFELVEYASVNILLPVGGLLICVFAAWKMAKASSFEELRLSRKGYVAWKVGVAFIAPACVILVLLNKVFGFLG